MKKEGLFDCCGAKHINQFNMRPSQPTYIPVWNSNTRRMTDQPVSALTALELFSKPSGTHPVPGLRSDFVYQNNSPGLLTCILRRDQHNTWKPHLERLGWQLVINNIQNSNSGNQLFFWAKISRPVPNRLHSFRFVEDQTPYLGVARNLGGGRYARVRRAPDAPLETIERVDKPSVEPLLIGVS